MTKSFNKEADKMILISKKSITFSIILLFIGVSFSSGISIDTNTTTIEDCGCNEVSDADLIKVERLFDRVEVYCKSVLVLSRYNPELKEVSEELLELNHNFDNFGDFPIICDMLENLENQFSDLFSLFINLANTSMILSGVFVIIAGIFWWTRAVVILVAIDLNCDWIDE